MTTHPTPTQLSSWQALADAATPEHLGALIDAASAVSSIAHAGSDGFQDVPYSHIAKLRRSLNDLEPLESAVLRGQTQRIPSIPALLATVQSQSSRIAGLEAALREYSKTGNWDVNLKGEQWIWCGAGAGIDVADAALEGRKLPAKAPALNLDDVDENAIWTTGSAPTNSGEASEGKATT